MTDVVPGIRLAVLLATVTWFYACRNDYPRMKRASWGECYRAFRDSAWGLLLIGIVVGGIYSGKFTPTEAAAVAAVYAFFIVVFVYRDLPLKRVPKVLLDAANLRRCSSTSSPTPYCSLS
jgi:C4-dicarboxylate transporter, DctM subunit